MKKRVLRGVLIALLITASAFAACAGGEAGEEEDSSRITAARETTRVYFETTAPHQPDAEETAEESGEIADPAEEDDPEAEATLPLDEAEEGKKTLDVRPTRPGPTKTDPDMPTDEGADPVGITEEETPGETSETASSGEGDYGGHELPRY